MGVIYFSFYSFFHFHNIFVHWYGIYINQISNSSTIFSKCKNSLTILFGENQKRRSFSSEAASSVHSKTSHCFEIFGGKCKRRRLFYNENPVVRPKYHHSLFNQLHWRILMKTNDRGDIALWLLNFKDRTSKSI